MTELKVRRAENAHVVHGAADRSLRAPGPLVIAAGAHVAGDIDARGSVHVGRGAFVAGAIRAMGEVVIGADARIVRGIRAEGRVLIQSGASVAGEVDAAADVQLAPHARIERLLVGGDLHVAQPVHAPAVRVRGRTFVEPA